MTAPAEITALRAPARLSWLAPARARLAAALERAGWPGDDQQPVILVAAEALANAIEHGSAAGGRVELAVEATPDRVRLRVADAGRAGAADWTPPPPPPPSSDHGRGLLIMRALADELEIVRRVGGGTELRLTLERAAAGVAAAAG